MQILLIRSLLSLLVFPTTTALAQTVAPVNLGSVINTEARDAEPTFTPDGVTMYFNCFDREGEEGSDISVSYTHLTLPTKRIV